MESRTEFLPDNQNFLTSSMLAPGYKADQDFMTVSMLALDFWANPLGICLGYAHTGIQAYLFHHTYEFDNYIKLIHKVFNRALEITKERLNISVSTIDELDEKSRGKLLLEIKKIISYLMLNLPQQDFENINRIFKTINDAYNSEYNNEFKNNEAPLLHIKKIVESEDIKKINDHINGFINPFFDLQYTAHDFESYLHNLKLALNGLSVRVGFVFINDKFYESNHVTSLGYDSSSEYWTLFDANHAPTLRSNDVQLIAEKIISSESGNESRQPPLSINDCKTTFSIKCYSKEKDEKIVEPIISKWTMEIAVNQYLRYLVDIEKKDINTPICDGLRGLHNIISHEDDENIRKAMLESFKALTSCEYDLDEHKNKMLLPIEKIAMVESLYKVVYDAYREFANANISNIDRITNAKQIQWLIKHKLHRITYPIGAVYQDTMITTLGAVLSKLPKYSDKYKKLNKILASLNKDFYDLVDLKDCMSHVKSIIKTKDNGACTSFYRFVFCRKAFNFSIIDDTFDNDNNLITSNYKKSFNLI